jgi:glyceraldehyde-3-phosphate dehydrogenase (NADP+)
LDKYKGKVIGKIPQASEEQMEKAISSANNAFQVTRKWSAGKRASMMEKLHQKLGENRDRFVDLIINEGGKPRSYAEVEIERCLSTLKIAIEETTRFGGEVVPMDFNNGEGKTAFTKRFPIGVVACITPFNFPLNLVMHKVAPALAVGCTVVIKPAPQAPMSCLAFAELFKEAGYPAGVINVLCCDIPVAEKLVKDERVAKLSFTGSDKVGWYLKSICGKKRVTLELGGNAAVIIDQDADVESIAEQVAKGAYLYAGQICISTQRIFVHEEIFDRFQKVFIKAIQSLKVGDPNDQEVLVGPVIDQGHLERIEDWVHEAEKGGAKIISGGKIKDKKTIEEMIDERELKLNTIVSHIEKLLQEGSLKKRDILYLKPKSEGFKEMLEEVKVESKKMKEIKLSPIFKSLGGVYSFEDIKFALLFC